MSNSHDAGQAQPGNRRAPVGDVVAAFLEACGVRVAFGVISIHNMPVLDAIARRAAVRFVPARGEAGAANMADAAARVGDAPGVVITSTGTGCGNAAGALVEAETAGSPLLHITGQIESAYLDRHMGYIHEARDQLGLLDAVSKAAYRVRHPDEVVATLKRALLTAMTAPRGPVSIEIPIDLQQAEIDWPADLAPHAPVARPPRADDIERLADEVRRARRPILWAGGGARHCRGPVSRLLDKGFALVTSTQGRGVVDEDDPRNLGAFNAVPAVESLYAGCDTMIAAGTRLRGNETLRYSLGLPTPLHRIDADPAADGRGYGNASFLCADAALALDALADALGDWQAPDPAFGEDVRRARVRAQADLRAGLGPYAALVDAVGETLGEACWVRDVTISNSTWGNRLPALSGPRQGVHALGGGIGQGLAMGIGAALAGEAGRAVALVGDGGLQLGLAELATAVEEAARLTLLVMNSHGYGVIRNIQDARYGGRRHYVDLLTPDLGAIAGAVGMPHRRLTDLDSVTGHLDWAAGHDGPVMIEVDMSRVGDFARRFDGPPVRQAN